MLFAANIAKLLRAKQWWYFIVPPVMSAVYFDLYFLHYGNSDSLMFAAVCLLTVVATAVFGFFLNDWSDIESDRIAGKENRVAKLAVWQRWVILMGSLSVAFFPFFVFDIDTVSTELFILQFVLLIMYSVSPVRLKKHVFSGILADSLYSGLIMMLAMLFLTQNAYFELKYPLTLLLLFALAFWMRGLRNILTHQLEDIAHDQAAHHMTFALRYGAESTRRIIRFVLFPAESVLNMALLILLSFHFPYCWLAAVLFVLYYLSKIFDKRGGKKDSNYSTLNDFYEDMIPLTLLIYLSIDNLFYLYLLVFHCIIFRNKIVIRIFYDLLYRKITLWFYYKAFCNRHAKRFYAFMGFHDKTAVK